ncbi:MAG: PDZ domain-containing protein, partial [Verrucomicrobiales bacterium]|nr:PDZ domain-containing protein [Verrucomicrobiales bacterium]
MDYSRDSAMVQITTPGKYPFVEIGTSKDKKKNDWCISLGHPGGYQADRSPPIRLGRIIANKNDEFLTSDCTLIGGDSGGPLFDVDGKLIGIHSNIGFSLSQNRHVPILTYHENWDRLKKGDRWGGKHEGGFLNNPERPVIGAMLTDADSGDGAKVQSIVPRSPAAKSLRVGDTILKADGKDVTSADWLIEKLRGHEVGDKVTMMVRDKDGNERGVRIELVAAGKLPRVAPPRPQPAPKGKANPADKGKGKGKAEGQSKQPEKKESPKAKAPEKKEAGKPKEEKKTDPKKPDAPKSAEKKEEKEANKDKEKEKEKSQAKIDPLTEEERKKLQPEFNKKMKEGLEKGRMELSPADMKKFGGQDGFRKFKREFEKQLSPKDRQKLMQASMRPKAVDPKKYDPDKPIQVGEKFFRDVLNAFRPSVSAASESTHLVFRGSELKSLGTVVHEDGCLLAKASEIAEENNQKLNVLIAKGKLLPAEIVKTYEKHDLALVRLTGDDTPEMTPVRWYPSSEPAPLGSLLSAAGSGPDPIAIGVVSVHPRSMSGENKGFLGVSTAPDEKGVRITMALPEGAARKAGVKRGDIITKINDIETDTPEKLIKLIGKTPPGTEITIEYLRNGEELEQTVELGNREGYDASGANRNGRMNRFGTDVSKKSSGYLSVMQTDLPIQPRECGGPVVDLDGNVIGINIARAGRIKTYALPSDLILDLIGSDMKKLDEGKSVGKPKEAEKKSDDQKEDPKKESDDSKKEKESAGKAK